MSRQSRLREYADPARGPHGCGRDQANIDAWSARAKENSKIAPRASDGEMRLSSTKMDSRDTGSKPYRSRNVDNAMKEAKADLNDVGGSSYMRGIRRNA